MHTFTPTIVTFGHLDIWSFGHFIILTGLTILDATRRYLTLLNAFRRCSTLLDATRRYSTLFNATRHYLAGRLGRQTWPADLASRLGRQTWPADLAGRLGRQTWPADLAGRRGRQTWPEDLAGRLVKIKDGLKIGKPTLFHLKNRLKTRVALIELLDLSGIAVGNVGVPTCYIFIQSLRRARETWLHVLIFKQRPEDIRSKFWRTEIFHIVFYSRDMIWS
jgi:hypothetical protein